MKGGIQSFALTLATALLAIWPSNISAQPGAPGVDAGVLWVTNTVTNDVAVFDAATGQLLATIPVGSTPVGIVATADKVYVAEEGDNRIAIIAKSTMSVVDRLVTAARPHHMTKSADGRFLAVGLFGTNRVAVIDTATDSLVEFATGAAEARSHQVTATLDGTLLVANSQVNEVAALDAASGMILWTLPVDTNPSEVLSFADDTMAFVSIRDEHKLQIIDLKNPSVVAEVPVGIQPDTLALTPDGNWLIVGLRGSPAIVAMVSVKDEFAVEWVSLEGTTTGHNTVSSSGRFSFVVIEGPSAGVGVIDHGTREVVAYYAYPGGGRPHGIFYEP